MCPGGTLRLVSIQAASGWDLTVGQSNIVVAVLDSGVNAAHPDLAGQILPGFDFVWNDTDPADDLGHGTAVTGTIIAVGNNGSGTAGVAFGCRLLPVKVLESSGYATYSSLAQGIRYASDHGARIINLSVGGPSPSFTLQAAVDYAWNNNVVLIAAAGNNANSEPQYPGACNHVIAVSATTTSDSLASFSTYGSFVSLSAPGANILTTQHDLSRPYNAWSGTSFASPIVAGVAALVVSENPSLSNTQVVTILEQTADDVGTPGRDDFFGYGRVNASRAVTMASTEPGGLPPPPPPPSDTNAPLITLTTAPKNGARLTVSRAILAGSASDDLGLREIQVRVNGALQPAEGTAPWTALISLAAGLNNVSVRSVDLAGNLSPEITRSFTFVVMAPLNAQVNGSGKISPNPEGKLYEIGKPYTLKAIPGPGQVFAGWNGESSLSTTFNFTMQSNLTIVASFVPTPFRPVTGQFAGLVADSNGVSPQTSGSFTMAVTTLGAFTGKLQLGGSRYGFSSRFDLDGNAVVSVKRKLSTPLTLTLHVDLNNTTDQIDGSLADESWVSALTGDRNVFNAKLNPAPQAGSRAFILERADDPNVTAATGASTISASGVTKVKGRLQDQRPFSASSLLAKNGDYPFYLSFQRGNEVAIGWMNFPSPTPTASGTVFWVCTGTNAFETTLEATSAP